MGTLANASRLPWFSGHVSAAVVARGMIPCGVACPRGYAQRACPWRACTVAYAWRMH